MKKFGILVPVVTPCDSQGQVDTQGLISVCNEMTGLGCKGIFALGSTGRGPWFGREDRIKICRAAVSAKKEDISRGMFAFGNLLTALWRAGSMICWKMLKPWRTPAPISP